MFPGSFRRRYGDELLELVQTSESPIRDRVNVLFACMGMRLASTAFGLGIVSALLLGSVALGGCVLLAALAVGAAGGVLANRFRLTGPR
jgi:hypothetical protein